MIAGIWGLLSSLPEILKFLKYAYSVVQKIGKIRAKAHLRSLIDEMINKGNQVEIEKAIGSDNAGLPSTHQEGVKTRPVHEETP